MQIKHPMSKAERERLNKIHNIVISPGVVEVHRLSDFGFAAKSPMWRGNKFDEIKVSFKNRPLFTITHDYSNDDKSAIIETAPNIGQKATTHITLVVDEMLRVVNEKAKMDRAFQREKQKEEELRKAEEEANAPEPEKLIRVFIPSDDFEAKDIAAYEALRDKLFGKKWDMKAYSDLVVRWDDGKVSRYKRTYSYNGSVDLSYVPETEETAVRELFAEIVRGCRAEANKMFASERVKDKIGTLRAEPVSHAALANILKEKRSVGRSVIELGDGFEVRMEGSKAEILLDGIDILTYVPVAIGKQKLMSSRILTAFSDDLDVENNDVLANYMGVVLAKANDISLDDVTLLEEDEVIRELEKIDFGLY